MALGGTLLPSISTFASGPTVKSKSIGSANLVSSLWSLFSIFIHMTYNHKRICEGGEICSLCFIFTVFSTVSLPCYYGILLFDTALYWGVHQFTEATPGVFSVNGAHMGYYTTPKKTL